MGDHAQPIDPAASIGPVASVETIDLQALRDHDECQSHKLLQACQQDGLFYLNMTTSHAELDAVIDSVYFLCHNIFQSPMRELTDYDVDKLCSRKLSGYKPIGRNRGGLDDGKDGFESYNIPKDGILSLGQAQWKRPELINACEDSLSAFSLTIIHAASTIFETLSRLLQIPRDAPHLQDFHRSEKVPSPDVLRLLRYHALLASERRASHISHTDLGSLTFLCSKQHGLQVQKKDNWEWVRPPSPGHVIVNLGDCLSMLTVGYLKSCLHRVSPFPGEESRERYSFAYLMRPEDQTPMKAMQSPLFESERTDTPEDVLTSGEWLQKKFELLRGDTWTQDKEWILTGVTKQAKVDSPDTLD